MCPRRAGGAPGGAQSLADEGRWVDIDLLLGSLEPGDLVPEEHELHAIALALTRRDDPAAAAMERAHSGWLEVGDTRRAARSAWWLGMYLMDLGHRAPAMGWFQRGARIVEEAELDESSMMRMGDSGYLRAFDKGTGEKVWEHHMTPTPHGTPMTYLHEGRQVLVVAVGGSTQPAELVAFALPRASDSSTTAGRRPRETISPRRVPSTSR